MDLRERINNEFIIFDGAMGTMLQSLGLNTGELPEILNIKDKNKIIDIHKKYIDAGAMVITTNTFGANEIKLKDTGFSVEEIISAAVDNARNAIGKSDACIALDIGPIGELLKPIGTLSFERAYDIFKAQIIQGVKSGVHLILIETITDLYEAKAAILAAKENSNLPVFFTMSFDESGRTFTGCSPEAMVITAEALGVDAVGINCSLGPIEMEPVINKILQTSSINIMVQPNAGLPCVCNGITEYKITPLEFSKSMRGFAEKGVRILGGCCGTRDEHIRALREEIKDLKPRPIVKKNLSSVCTPTKIVEIDKVRVIGERINPTGKKLFREALKNNDLDYALREAAAQVEAGAEILDVNVGVPGIDEAQVMTELVQEIQSIIDAPLQIDSNNPKVIESALRIYNGKAIVNSVNGDDEILDAVLPIIKKYGASVVGLTLDHKGIPKTAEERFKIAEKIIKKAEFYGIEKKDIYIDCLTLTAAAQQKEVRETIKALSMVKEKLEVKTVLGVSNVSFGLPNRGLVNRTFLSAALSAGLDLPIINPLDSSMMDVVNAFRVIWFQDENCVEYLKIYNKTEDTFKNIEKKEQNLFQIIEKGLKDEAKGETLKLLQVEKPLDIVNNHIIPALDSVGVKYENGDIFLPQLIQSAETVKSAFAVIKENIETVSGKSISKGKVILATVKGDVHDIGKNIVKVLLESYGFEVIDLGKDVPKEKVAEEAIKNNVKLIGLSALMTTTVINMKDTIAYVKDKCPNCMVMAGGAVLNEAYAKSIGADFYGKDARESVNIAQSILK
ncbi:MAG: homocysteine S-methyltransferase family protein [Solirubrobacterales bacterium]